MVEYLENDLRGRQRRPWICSLCRWQSQLLGLRTNSGGWRDLPHFSILPWPSAFLPALSLPFGIFSSWTPISNSFFVFSFYERSSWHGVIVTLLWRSGEGKYVHLEKVTLHRKVTLTLRSKAPIVVMPLCARVSGVWSKVMRSVAEEANFFFHFGAEERACPWRGV